MTETITAPQALERIRENMQATLKMVQVRVVGKLPKNGYIRQGDLYLTIGNIADKGAIRTSLQLVPGNTAGSRHCIVESPHVTSYESLAKPVTIDIDGNQKIARFPGPLIVALSEWSITHPKHGWMTKIFEGVFQSWQQCSFTHQRPTKD
jgi:hypothetical protein